MLRNLMLRMADNPAMVGFLARQGMKSGFATRFIAGDSVEEAVVAIRELNGNSICASLDLLGEGVTDEEEAKKATLEYVHLLDVIRESGVDSNISIKLTQLGLDISPDVCSAHLKLILNRAGETRNFVRIDMEASAYTEDTVDVFEEHFKIYGRERVGIVLQAYLYRTENDVRRLARLGCNIRLCKGAYKEPAEIAYPRKEDVDASFLELLRMLLTSDAYTAIASHDETMIQGARDIIAQKDLAVDRYEFQMLYGIRRDSQVQLRKEGHKMRVYVPFGTQWAPYFIRRLAERPANILFVLKNLRSR